MRGVVQRVIHGKVTVGDKVVGKIGKGILLFLGIGKDDDEKDLEYIFDKTINLRIFEDEDRKMNRSLMDVKGQLLIVPQFTLYGDCRKGRRPGFSESASADIAKKMYRRFIDKAREKGIETETGKFAAMMDVEFVNQGPVTLILDSQKIL